MDDTISRQAAIDLANELYQGTGIIETTYNGVRKAIIAFINLLPPIQPEVTRCKDCKHRPKLDEDGELDFPPTYRCPCYCDDCYYSWMPKDDWFCGNGERKS